MDLNLNKLPWYGQVGLFVALALGGVAAFYYMYADAGCGRDGYPGAAPHVAPGRHRERRGDRKPLNQFRQQVAELEARLESLKAVLPEQKDVADLLRRIQTLATQSNLAIRGFKPAPSITRQLHAEWPIALQLDGTYHNLGDVLRSRQQVLLIINVSRINIRAKDKPEPNSTITAECVATTFVLLDTAKPAPAKAN